MIDLSVIIPSRQDRFLQRTIDDLFAKARSTIEVIVVLDGYVPRPLRPDPRLTVLSHGTPSNAPGMRASINKGMAAAQGQYVMKVDEHCMFAEGYDTALIADYRPDWVAVPRRWRLDPEQWAIIKDDRPPVDYMVLRIDDGYLHGVAWGSAYHKRTAERSKPEYEIDNTQSIQGSCWFMSREYWLKRGPMDDAHYGPFAQEAQEIGCTAWLGGSGILVNKRTWYAHWHKDSKDYGFSRQQRQQFQDSVEAGRKYSTDFWVNNRWAGRKRDFKWLMDGFANGTL